jgi:hypothetical protein
MSRVERTVFLIMQPLSTHPTQPGGAGMKAAAAGSLTGLAIGVVDGAELDVGGRLGQLTLQRR